MMNCRKVHGLVTDYLEDALDFLTRKRFEFHLRLCPSCEVHVAKMQDMIEALGAIPPETEVPDQIRQHFEQWIAENEPLSE